MAEQQETKEQEGVQFIEKGWNDFRKTGLFRFVKTFLQIFGWAIVLDLNDAGEVVGACPARVEYDGFCEHEESLFFRLGKFMAEDEFFKKNNERRAAEFGKRSRQG